MEAQTDPLPAHDLVSLGIDYLTSTAARHSGNHPFRDAADEALHVAASQGNEVRDWKWKGYHGRTCDGVSIGVRRDSWICVLKSEDAREHALKIIPLASSISRLDTQVTLAFKQPQPDFITRQYQDARARFNRRRKLCPFTHHFNERDGETLAPNQRISDRYGRLYDKGMESKIAERGRVVRWEVEFKRKVAKHVATTIVGHQVPNDAILASVSGYFSKKRIVAPAASYRVPPLTRADGQIADARSLGWLAQSARPTIERLILRGLIDDVIKAVGLAAYVVKMPDDVGNDEP